MNKAKLFGEKITNLMALVRQKRLPRNTMNSFTQENKKKPI